jgi:hypothetical protein
MMIADNVLRLFHWSRGTVVKLQFSSSVWSGLLGAANRNAAAGLPGGALRLVTGGGDSSILASAAARDGSSACAVVFELIWGRMANGDGGDALASLSESHILLATAAPASSTAESGAAATESADVGSGETIVAGLEQFPGNFLFDILQCCAYVYIMRY